MSGDGRTGVDGLGVGCAAVNGAADEGEAVEGAAVAELIVTGGIIRTMNSAVPMTDSVAIADGRIIALGEDDVSSVRGEHTEVLDLGGATMLPGFIDAHIHPVMGGLRRVQCDLSELHDLCAYRDRIADYAATHPEAPWVLGGGWYGDVFDGGFPDRRELDSLVPDRPAALGSHDGHGVWVNSAALAAAGITDETPDPPGGHILRDAEGVATGMLVESAADLVYDVIPPVEPGEVRAALLDAQSYLHSLGVVAWQDAAVGEALGLPDCYDLYCELAESGALTARVTGDLWWYPDRDLDQIESMTKRRDALSNNGLTFSATAVKIIQDGVCENFTAALTRSYHQHPHEHGMSFIEPQQLRRVVAALDAAGFDVHLHAVGDRAVRESLDAFSDTANADDRRHQIAHIDLIAPDDVARMRDTGVIANIQPLWAREDPVLVETKLPFLDEDHQNWHFAFGSLAEAGVPLAMGSDWPVSSPDPLWGIHTAVNRTAPAGDPHAQDEHSQTVPLLAEQGIDIDAALHAYTIGAARAARLDEFCGSIEVGKDASLVVLDADPMTADPRHLGDIRVKEVFVRGVRM